VNNVILDRAQGATFLISMIGNSSNLSPNFLTPCRLLLGKLFVVARWLALRFSVASSFFVTVIAVLLVLFDIDPAIGGLLLSYSMQFYNIQFFGSLSSSLLRPLRSYSKFPLMPSPHDCRCGGRAHFCRAPFLLLSWCSAGVQQRHALPFHLPPPRLLSFFVNFASLLISDFLRK